MARDVQRLTEVHRIERLLREHRVVGLLGARQVGKSTLARMLAGRRRGPVHFYDLEDARDLARLAEPMSELEGLSGLVILDEIQRRPELFPSLRVLVDRPRAPRYLVLGSASPELLRQSSETLAGRIVFHHVRGFSIEEVGAARCDELWLRGGFPRSYLAPSRRASAEWRQAFVRTFVEREVPQLGFQLPAASLERFWRMLAHWHGQIWNGSELGRSLGVSDTTVRRWLDLLAGTFVVDVLRPFHENLAKRQIRAPKVYLSDSGILHAMLDLQTREQLLSHPKLGASFEGFALGAVVRHLGAEPDQTYFWGTQSGAELDLLVLKGGRRRGFEFKRADAPRLSPSMRIALGDLKLDSLDVIYPGPTTYRLEKRIRAVPISRLLEDVEP